MRRLQAWPPWIVASLMVIFLQLSESRMGTSPVLWTPAAAFNPVPNFPKPFQSISKCTNYIKIMLVGGDSTDLKPLCRLSASLSTSSPVTTPTPILCSNNSHNSRDCVDRHVVKIASNLRQSLKKKSGSESVGILQKELEIALRKDCLDPSASSSVPGVKSKRPRKTNWKKARQTHASTRRLLVALVRDFARYNVDPGVTFWSTFEAWLAFPRVIPPTGEIASLVLALAILDVPPGSEGLLNAGLQAACTERTASPRTMAVADAQQFCKALTLLRGPGATFRVGPAAGMARLLASLEREVRAAKDPSRREDRTLVLPKQTSGTRWVRRPSHVSAPQAETERVPALTCSLLHRRVLDALRTVGLVCEDEVCHAGLRLDVVVYPPSIPPSAPPSLFRPRLPLVIEIDGPQHFIHGDPTRPTGATVARHRFVRSQQDQWAGLVSLTHADAQGEKGRTPVERLLAVLEAKVREQAGVELAGYRTGAGGAKGNGGEGERVEMEASGGRERRGGNAAAYEGKGKMEQGKTTYLGVEMQAWELSKRLLVSRSSQEVLSLVEEARQGHRSSFLDASHFATALTRLARISTRAPQPRLSRRSNKAGLRASNDRNADNRTHGTAGNATTTNYLSNSSSNDTIIDSDIDSFGNRESGIFGSISSKTGQKKESVNGCHRWVGGPAGLLGNTTQALAIIGQADFPALALLIEAMIPFYEGILEKRGEKGGDGCADDSICETEREMLAVAEAAIARVAELEQRSMARAEEETRKEDGGTRPLPGEAIRYSAPKSSTGDRDAPCGIDLSSARYPEVLMTSWSLVTFLHAISRLGYHSWSLPVSASRIQTMISRGQLDAPALVSVLTSLTMICLRISTPPATLPRTNSSCMLPDSPSMPISQRWELTFPFSTAATSILPSTEGVFAAVDALVQGSLGQLHLLSPRDLVSFVRAITLFEEAGYVLATSLDSRACHANALPSSDAGLPSFLPSSFSPYQDGIKAMRTGTSSLTPQPTRERLITSIVEAAGKPHISQSLSLSDLAVLTLRAPADGEHEEVVSNQRDRRKSPQWPLIKDVRRRLRSMSPSALVKFLLYELPVRSMTEGAWRQEPCTIRRQKFLRRTSLMLQPRPTRAFLMMLTNELYKQRAALTVREKASVIAQLRAWEDIYDPGTRFWQRFP